MPVDKDGNPIPLERQQPHRILGFMPNFRSVGGGEIPHAPGWKYNFKIATRQSFDYSSFIFLGITTLSAEGINSHPVLGKGADGFYAYIWRGFLDKTDGTYIGAWFLPSLLHEDTRYYAMGNRRPVPIRILYVMSRQVVTRTYGEHQTPNIAGLGGKVLTQIVSRQYYPQAQPVSACSPRSLRTLQCATLRLLRSASSTLTLRRTTFASTAKRWLSRRRKMCKVPSLKSVLSEVRDTRRTCGSRDSPSTRSSVWF